MKNILHILLISCFSFTIISCAEVNSTMDDIRAKSLKAEQATNSTISEKHATLETYAYIDMLKYRVFSNAMHK